MNNPTVPLSVLNECLARVAAVETRLYQDWEDAGKSVEGKSEAAIALELAQAEGKLIAQGMLEVMLDKIQLDLSDLGITVEFQRSTNV